MLGAAVLVGALVPIVLLRVVDAILTAVPFAVRVTVKPHTGLSARSHPQALPSQPDPGPHGHGATSGAGGTCGGWSHHLSLHCPTTTFPWGWQVALNGKFKGNKNCLQTQLPGLAGVAPLAGAGARPLQVEALVPVGHRHRCGCGPRWRHVREETNVYFSLSASPFPL